MKQGDSLLVHYKDEWAPAELAALKKLRFQRDWVAKKPQALTEFVLAADEGILHFLFSCQQKPTYDPSAKDNLWHHDVAELFLAQEGKAGYLEINLAPSGAQWSQSFSGPRQVGPGGPDCFAIGGATNSAQIWDDRWSLHFELPLREPLREAILLNVTAIINHAADLQYLSWLNLHAVKPDFHRPHEFLPIVLKKY